MVQFTRLRLHGFKSFIDKTELDIGAGMNGVVGPNGCGKSNLVEALRWVMGESSAKRMRGDGMEDVIFNGTDKRTARNVAEVSLLLDNTDRKAPALYNGSDEIEITRKIEREKGSNYRINGRPVRARDVQMFFADSVSGANSPALVSQGRVTEIIKAKPMERRLILEDSAGISGLFVRRHEAELKLKAASNNLQRIDDVYGSMESRLHALRRQVKQAEKYRRLSGQIRELEMVVAHMEYAAAGDAISATKARFNEAESEVAQKLTAVTQLTKTHNTQSADLPDLRKAEAEAAARLQAHKVALQRLEDEQRHQQELLKNAQDQRTRLVSDQQHEERNKQETETLLTQLEDEQRSTAESLKQLEDDISAKDKRSQALQVDLQKLEERYNALMQSAAQANAKKAALNNQITQNQRRLDTINQRRDRAMASLEALRSADTGAQEVTDLQSHIDQTQVSINKRSAELVNLQSAVQDIEDRYPEAQNALQDTRSGLQAQRSEITMLERFFSALDAQDFTAVLDDIKADQGFEKALSRAMGDTLLASLDVNAPSYWQRCAIAASALPALAGGLKPLSDAVNAPDILKPALSQIGVIDSGQDAPPYLPQLQSGQAIVSRDGMYYRWDGLVISDKAADKNSVQLEHKNKLDALQKALPDLEAAKTKAEADFERIQADLADHKAKYKDAQTAQRDDERRVHSTTIKLAQIKEQRARHDSQLEHLEESIKESEADSQSAADSLAQERAKLEQLEQNSGDAISEEALAALHNDLKAQRSSHGDAIRDYDRTLAQRGTMQARLQAIGDERVNAKNRNIRAAERLKDIHAHIEQAIETLDNLKAQPVANEGQKDALLDKISEADKARDKAAEALSVCEGEVNKTSRALKASESALGDAREARALAQAQLANDQANLERIMGAIGERFSMPAPALKNKITMDLAPDLSLGDYKSSRDDLMRSRERMGAVNLRADEECAALEEEFSVMISERDDLLAAIEELQSGIQTINKEARERLIVAFDKVNGYFQELFQQLFVGGKAHLELVGSSDPLEAGLEIFAQPPGKSLQSLSLLSGGEQTMASIALIFGMFLTNPSPICVLDEIDAPLDDANVDRVCNLLETIAARGETRFIVITHHRLTMARMNCLYGVTMQERGVSQLVSVDLQQSFDFIEAA